VVVLTMIESDPATKANAARAKRLRPGTAGLRVRDQQEQQVAPSTQHMFSTQGRRIRQNGGG
jgi:hypothetical protein